MQFKVYDGHPPIEVNKKEEAELDSYLDELDGQ
jgi:phospholipid-binding lipoprotein MlaA